MKANGRMSWTNSRIEQCRTMSMKTMRIANSILMNVVSVLLHILSSRFSEQKHESNTQTHWHTTNYSVSCCTFICWRMNNLSCRIYANRERKISDGLDSNRIHVVCVRRCICVTYRFFSSSLSFCILSFGFAVQFVFIYFTCTVSRWHIHMTHRMDEVRSVIRGHCVAYSHKMIASQDSLKGRRINRISHKPNVHTEQ